MAGEAFMTFRPTTPEDVVPVVADAMATGAPIVVRGTGSKDGLGHPAPSNRVLDLSGLTGIVAYEPAELVLTVRTGTPVDEIHALLGAENQELAFEPMAHGAVYGTGAGSIGGLVAANLSGPRRIKAGAARDHVLGVEAVSGRGEAFKVGGRVVKNVTGYDVSKVLTGSHGTLAVMTAVTLKVLPRAETAATLVLAGFSDARAVEAMAAAMGSPADVSGAAHLPPSAAGALGFATAVTLLRLEGVAPSVNERFDRLATLLRPYGTADRLDADATAATWTGIRDVAPFGHHTGTALWRVSVAPTAGPAIGAALRGSNVLYDWAGGLVWIAVAPEADCGAAALRAAIRAAGGGHATLVRAPDAIRSAVPVFEPQPAPLAALSRRLKSAFDPAHVLNPGRMGEGL